ncbi:MAG TPA: pyruvate, phosphate dikinase [Candidatus Thermoplasmatota archaeon]|nr:pyruvate, phosphate dikinase [Candidatus Thermoplasmatota archaeon]
MATADVQRVYAFQEGDAGMKAVLGGKGANLAEMARIGLPVPPGFTITAQTCIEYQKHGQFPAGLEDSVWAALARLEKEAGATFGDPKNPLLVSVRSGAAISMPGMMDTVLNLGLNDKTVEGMAKATGNPRFAWDSYRRFLTMFGDVVLGLEHHGFEDRLKATKARLGVELDTQIPAKDLERLASEFKQYIQGETGRPFEQDPKQQLLLAIEAVFKSWNNDRAVFYRNLNKIPHEMGTAVNVQMMVFGNMGDDCATGVAFTRDPSSGEKVFYGEFLVNAQGEDVVAGTRTPQPINKLDALIPAAAKQLRQVAQKLETHFRDMQDIEFTIMRGKLYMLQTRTGKRTGFAAVRIALDMLDEKVVTESEALLRVSPDNLNQLLRPIFDAKEKAVATKDGRILAKGLNAGPGAATGRVVFTADEAVEWKKKGEHVILVRDETSPEDIHGMHASEGFLTARGGMTSHAALVARQMGKVCVAGCTSLRIDYRAGAFAVGDRLVREGDWISLDGFTGEVIQGKLTTLPSEVVQVLVEGSLKPAKAPVYQMFDRLLKMADKVRRMRVRANADQPDQAQTAIAFGAEGIGLCRTEHMFFGPGKIEHMREMILAENEAERREALKDLLPLQRADFEGIFRAMGSRPVTVRMLDPPLHEFLPHEEREQRQMALMMQIGLPELQERIEALRESNPMLGHRGCRLGITYPEITEMQARAILEAAVNVKRQGVDVHPEIMIPIVGFASEFRNQEALVRKVAEQVFREKGAKVAYSVGTMIELPRAALTADEIAQSAEFFSFGTNDLTQTTLGLSRDDAGSFMGHYLEGKIVPYDPFQTIDFAGVGQLVQVGTQKGRSTRKDLKVGICGEHGGDADSVKFCHRTGLDYVSCSPYRLPIARLAAAHAVLEERAAKK